MTDELIPKVTRGNFTCPWCDEPNDAAAYVGSDPDKNRAPRPGDIGICASCAKPMVYQEVGKPRRPTEGEWKNLNSDPDVTAARKAIFMSNHGNVSYRDIEVRVTNDDENGE